MASIALDQVSKIYAGGLYGVQDVTLSVAEGEFVILLGPSGCGKSTTLRMIAGLESVTTGEVFIGGERVNEMAPRERNVAVVFQSYALYPHMTVWQNMAFGIKMRGMAFAEIETRVRDAARLLGISPLLGRKPAALSGGQRQRVALGRAIVRDPVAFLLDEPLSNLDAQLRAEMRLELVKLHRRLGRTTVYVTHDQVEAMTMGDRICILRDGRLIQSGPPLEVYANPADTFVARFLASPPMNLIPAHLEAGADEALILVVGSARLPVPECHRAAYAPHAGRAVLLGLRAEDLYESPHGAESHPITLQADAVEALGAESILVAQWGAAGGAGISARLGRSFRAAVGAEVTLHADLASMHLFDPESGRVIARPALARP